MSTTTADPAIPAAQWANRLAMSVVNVTGECAAEWQEQWDSIEAAAAKTRRDLLVALLASYSIGIPQGEDAGAALAALVADAAAAALSLGWEARRPSISGRLRTTIYRRDGYVCVECGEDDITRLSVDHRIPVVLGGTNEPSNLRTLCKPCNSRKGAAL